MKIAVNTRLLIPGKLEGIGWFTFQTFRRMALDHPEAEFTFIFDRPYSQEFVFAPNVNPVVLYPQARHPVLYYLFFEHAIPRYLKKHPHDLFISPDGMLSLNYPGKQIPVCHDLNFIHHPENLPWLSSQYYNKMFPRYIRQATRVATVSEYSKDDIVKTFGYPDQKVDVVYNGAHQVFQPIGQALQQQVRRRYTGGDPYFVYVGALHKRKNIENMLLAFDAFRNARQSAYKLLIVGETMFGSGSIRKAYASMHHRQDVIFVGRLFEEALRDVIASARGLLLVSYFEGFGIPILEAMKCEVPVITSQTTSMPEVAGGAAALVDPDSVESISQAMTRVAFDDHLVEEMILMGREVSQRFSWQKTADLMWQCVQKSLQQTDTQ
ncbi:MAG: glycosyltransferase family 1 protein [Bacteroidales bacterium]